MGCTTHAKGWDRKPQAMLLRLLVCVMCMQCCAGTTCRSCPCGYTACYDGVERFCDHDTDCSGDYNCGTFGTDDRCVLRGSECNDESRSTCDDSDSTDVSLGDGWLAFIIGAAALFTMSLTGVCVWASRHP